MTLHRAWVSGQWGSGHEPPPSTQGLILSGPCGSATSSPMWSYYNVIRRCRHECIPMINIDFHSTPSGRTVFRGRQPAIAVSNSVGRTAFVSPPAAPRTLESHHAFVAGRLKVASRR